jgi:hypothetical protein
VAEVREQSPIVNVTGGFQLPDLPAQHFPLRAGRELGDLRFQSCFLGCYVIFEFMRDGLFPIAA